MGCVASMTRNVCIYFSFPNSLNLEYLTTVQQGDRNHWRNREWNADAKIFVLSMQHIPKRVFIFCQKVKQWKLFDVNLRHFLCLCVRAYYTVLVSYNFDSDSISVLKSKGKLDKWFIWLILIIFWNLVNSNTGIT